MRKYYGSACQDCGSKKKLEFAHLKYTGLNGHGRGSYKRIRNIMDYPDAYRLLCHSCHLKFDRKQRESSK
jgi:hypothetical protein